MASPYAFVTLLTSDSYLPGALTLAAALKDVHPFPVLPPEVDFQTVCLVTPETVDVASIKLLRKTFDVVFGVEVIEEDNERGLQLLGEYHPSCITAFLYYTVKPGHRGWCIRNILPIWMISRPLRMSRRPYSALRLYMSEPARALSFPRRFLHISLSQ
jgi:hypothetical protein